MVTQEQYLHPRIRWRQSRSTVVLLLLCMAFGCGGKTNFSRDNVYKPPPRPLAPMGHTIQVGAFSNIDNAVRLTSKLQNRGINAYHFLHQSGLYKVRFGNFSSKDDARKEAQRLKALDIIDVFYLVGPTNYAATTYPIDDDDQLRKEIVKTANRYIGVAYRWGGESPNTGFDCSGLTMVVYRLNGLHLPRSSGQQWNAGKPVSRDQLSDGDLVFFATSGGRRVSHVGIYTGNGKFLHAPGKGRRIRVSSLSNSYFKPRYLGARTYL